MKARPGPTTVTLRRPDAAPAGPRVRDVLAALVGAGGRDGPVGDGQHGGDLVGTVGMADPDPPRPPGLRLAAGDDVATGVDPVVATAGAVDQPGGLLDRPALDEPRRVEPAVRPVMPRVERAAGRDREVIAGGQDMADVEARVLLGQRLAAPAG